MNAVPVLCARDAESAAMFQGLQGRHRLRIAGRAVAHALERWILPTDVRDLATDESLMSSPDAVWRGAPLAFADRVNDELEAFAGRLGLEPGRFVMLHVRESGFKPAAGLREGQVDRQRNADPATFGEAIDYLIESGYRVVRIGDASMQPMHLAGVVDLPFIGASPPQFALWCAMQCRLFICCDSGPYVLTRFSAAACLAVNVLDLTAYAARGQDRFIPKIAVEPVDGHELSLAEMIERGLLAGNALVRGAGEERDRLAADAVTYRDNSSEEIAQAVREMFESSDQPTAPQLRFRELLEDRVAQLQRPGKRPFSLGAGHIAQGFAERHLYQPSSVA